MRSFHVSSVVFLGALAASCGGKAVVDGSPGGGGEGGTTTGTTTGTTSTTSSGQTTTSSTTSTTSATSPQCSDLEAVLWGRLEAAMACNPMLAVEQCTGELVVYDTCGCMLAANALSPGLVDAALSAYYAWSDACFGPWPCEWCPPSPPYPWFCMPGPSGQSGRCEPGQWGE